MRVDGMTGLPCVCDGTTTTKKKNPKWSGFFLCRWAKPSHVQAGRQGRENAATNSGVPRNVICSWARRASMAPLSDPVGPLAVSSQGPSSICERVRCNWMVNGGCAMRRGRGEKKQCFMQGVLGSKRRWKGTKSGVETRKSSAALDAE